MDIDRIKYFHVFAETGSLVKASEILHISQPALSKAFKLLEQEVGSKLFESDGRGLKLSRQGQILKAETAPLLEKWLHIPQKLKHYEQTAPSRIGTFEVFSTHFLGHISSALTGLELHEYGPGKLEEAIVSGQVDIGITYLPIPKAQVDFIEVTKIEMGVFGKRAGLPFAIPIFPHEGTPNKVIGLDGWPDHKFHRKISYRVTLLESALELARQGLCVLYIPKFVAVLQNEKVKADYKLQELECEIPVKQRLQSVYLMKRQNSEESKLYRDLAKVLRGIGR